jgi:hypothetical protein
MYADAMIMQGGLAAEPVGWRYCDKRWAKKESIEDADVDDADDEGAEKEAEATGVNFIEVKKYIKLFFY